MRYAGDIVSPPGPHIVHYGIDWHYTWVDAKGVERQYSFNKLLYLSLDAASCPRWFFPLAPFASADSDTKRSYRELVCGRQIADFNRALCGYYKRHCMEPPRCPLESVEATHKSGSSWCVDLNQNCLSWSRHGECLNNPGFSEILRPLQQNA